MRSHALIRPNLIVRAVSLIALIAVIVVVVLVASGSSSYKLKLTLANADGLQTGSQVFLGGVPVGTVSALDLNGPGNAVIATLSIGKGEAHVGKGARADIIATNLLGTESVQLSPGARSQPVPSGTVLPVSATTVPTALDQIVDVLNQPTRVDLALMLQEAGAAVAGRKADVSAILRQLPLSLQAATSLLQNLVTNNHSLADFIANSNQFITRVNGQSPALKRLLTAAGGAAQTFSNRAGALAQTVQRAPQFFTEVKAYFTSITTAANHLEPVTGLLADAMPPLDATLKAIKPFANAAVPTLNRAADVAPSLSDLAVRATPTLKQAVPTVGALSNLAQLSQPLSAWLGLSAPDLIDIFDSWSHAIQGRDGVSHVFNGDLYLNPQIVLNAADAGATPTQKAQNLVDLAPSIVKQLGLQSAVTKARALLALLAGHTTSPKATTPAKRPTATPAKLPVGSSGTTTSKPTAPSTGSGSGLGGVLGGLLGSLSGHGGGGTTAAPGGASGASGTGGGLGQTLSGLLGYLVGDK
jgi:phospholipid/cholesterol/gamma-HCH transport system substrate-binding protein